MIPTMQGATLLTTVSARTDMQPAIRAAAVIFAAASTAAASQLSLSLPLTTVPFTLQPMVVLLAGAALGSRLGMTSQALFLLAGISGLPVFAASPVLPQGFLRLLGPTGGFLMMFPIAAFLTGWLAERGFDRRYDTSVVAMAAGLAMIFAGGVAWLAWFAQPAPVGVRGALQAGLYPFVLADAVKILIASTILPIVWKVIGAGSSDVRKFGRSEVR